MTVKSQKQNREKWMEDTNENDDWISCMHSQGRKSTTKTKRGAREKVGDNKGPYLNVSFPQVTNIMQWPQFPILKCNRAIQDHEYTLK